jgi:DNA-binding response OmpR family regulator
MTESKMVLIVDDEPDIRTFLADLLTTQGYRCMWAESGPAALAQIGHLKPDVVLLDIMMPGLSGIETLRLIRERDDVDPAVIMVSCLSHPNTTLRAMDEGADHFVVKPFRIAEITEIVGRALRERSSSGRDRSGEPKTGAA